MDADTFPRPGTEQPRQAGVDPRRFAWLFAALLVVDALSFAFGDQGRSFGFAGLTVLPFALLAGLSYRGETEDRSRFLALGLLGLIAVLGVFMFMGYAAQLLQAAEGIESLSEHAEKQLALVFLVCAHGLGLGVLMLLAQVRRAASRLVPMDPGRFVHAVAMALTLSLIVSALAPLVVLGEPPITSLFALEGAKSNTPELSEPMYAQLYPMCWLIPVSFLAVGYGIRRTLRQAAERLGLVVPTLGQILAAAGIAVLLVIAALVTSYGIDTLWTALDWPRTDQDAFGELMGNYLNPLGAVIVAVSAGVGEELVVRGVLQPRIGLVMSNVLFAALHAGQYNWDLLLVILMLGMVFGLIRKYRNTTMSAITHGFYDLFIIYASMGSGN